MARDFDGVDDVGTITQVAALNDWNLVSLCAWVDPVALGESSAGFIIGKATGAGVGIGNFIFRMGGTNVALFSAQLWDTTVGTWTTDANMVPNGVRTHVAVTYDYGAVTNEAVLYVNGVSVTVTQSGVDPSGALSADADNITIGNRPDTARTFNGDIGWCVATNVILDAAAINRAKWWGRPHGGMQVYHPLATAKVTNEGAAAADVAITGAVGKAMACPVVRPGAAMMGMGIGW